MPNDDLISRGALLKHKCDFYNEDGRSLTHYITNISSYDVTYGRYNDVREQYVYNGDARNRNYHLRCATKMGGGTDDD